MRKRSDNLLNNQFLKNINKQQRDADKKRAAQNEEYVPRKRKNNHVCDENCHTCIR